MFGHGFMGFRFKIFAAFFLFSCFGSEAFPDSCGEVRMDKAGGSMSNIPVMDQDGLGICYAYVATQMIDAYRFSHGDTDYNHITSPLVMSIQMKADDTSDDESLDLGLPQAMLNFARNASSCSHYEVIKKWGGTYNKYVVDNILAFYDNYWARKKEHLKKLRKKTSELFDSNFQSASDHKFDEFQKIEDDKKRTANEVYCYLVDSCYKGPSISLFLPKGFVPSIEAIEKFLDEDKFSFLNGLIQKTCEKHSKKINIPDYEVMLPSVIIGDNLEEGEKAIKQDIHKRLNSKNPQPIGMGFCSSSLTQSNYVGVLSRNITKAALSFGLLEKYPKIKDDCNLHGSIIIGRKEIAGKCHFLVRNTWGTTCFSYKWPCENGNVWVDEDVLSKNIFYTLGIKDEKE